MRIGLLGGVFNPPHLGHLVCAQEALVTLGLDEVRLVPVGSPPHREVEGEVGALTRLAMCEAAVRDDDRLHCSRTEVERPGPSYTADTIRALRAGLAEEDELVLVLGADQARELAGWREPETVLELARVAVATRGEISADEVLARLAEVRGAEWLRFLEMPRIDISSSLVRRRVAEGLPVRYLVPEAVERMIAERGLYGSSGGA